MANQPALNPDTTVFENPDCGTDEIKIVSAYYGRSVEISFKGVLVTLWVGYLE